MDNLWNIKKSTYNQNIIEDLEEIFAFARGGTILYTHAF